MIESNDRLLENKKVCTIKHSMEGNMNDYRRLWME